MLSIRKRSAKKGRAARQKLTLLQLGLHLANCSIDSG